MKNFIEILKKQDPEEWKNIFRMSLKIVGIGLILGLILIFIFSRGLTIS